VPKCRGLRPLRLAQVQEARIDGLEAWMDGPDDEEESKDTNATQISSNMAFTSQIDCSL